MLGLSGTSFGECFHCLSQLPWLESGLGASPQLCLAWAGCLLDRRTPVACVPCTVTSPVFCEHVLVFAGFRSAAQSGLPDLSPLPASHRSTLHQVVASCGKQATTISFGEATSQTLQRKSAHCKLPLLFAILPKPISASRGLSFEAHACSQTSLP